MTTPPSHVQAPRSRPGVSHGGRAGALRGWLAGASRRRLYLMALAAAAVVAGILIGVSALGGSSPKTTAGPITGAASTTRLLAGIQQSGTTLGSAKAPYVLVEYADFQCPYCGDWARDIFPAVVKSFVRPGTVQIVFRGLTFVGPDSKTALETALAAASQNRFWNVADLLYRNQGIENTGWVSDSLLRGILGAVPGLGVSSVLAERSGAPVAKSLAASSRLAALAGVQQTPTFAIGPLGGTLEPLTFGSLDAASFTKALKAATGG